MIARVRPVTKEDGEGPEATNAVTFDPDDDSIIHLLHKGKPVSFELDKVFSSQASQQDVSVAPAERGTERHTSHEGLQGPSLYLWRREEGGKAKRASEGQMHV